MYFKPQEIIIEATELVCNHLNRCLANGDLGDLLVTYLQRVQGLHT